MTSRSLDEAFQLLHLASDLEEKKSVDRIELGKDENDKILLIVTKYLEACQLLFQHAEQKKINKSLMDRSTKDVAAEKLLQAKAEQYSKHALQLLNNRGNKILDHAIKVDEQSKELLHEDELQDQIIIVYMEVAEYYIQALKILHEENVRRFVSCSIDSVEVLNQRLQGIFDRVETLKGVKSTICLDNSVSKQARNVPVSSLFTSDEIVVLKQSSLMSSGLFLPWDENEALQFNAKMLMGLSIEQKLFTDPDGLLKLSKSQIESGFKKWARPSEIAMKRYKGKPVIAQNTSPYSIKQTCVTDCSFIASLCICAAYERRFKRKIVTSLIYPRDKNGAPLISSSGKYMVKLWLNGIARRVIVDDLLPIDKNGLLLCSHVSSSQLDLWVPILEKAYMKLCGGYDFPGSNSAVDMFSLTGWVPERIFFAENESKVQDFETPAERAWERLKSASSFGDCLITVSTSSKLTESEANSVGLVTAHAYAVLDVIESKQGTRLLQLKNPWMKGGWKGKFSSFDRINWTESLQRECRYNLKEAIKHNDGIFWICWKDILLYFQNIFISWNPALFPHKAITHASWPKDQGPRNDSFNCGENPQYMLSFSDEALRRKASVWILLSRHVSKSEQEGDEPSDYLTLHIYRATCKSLIWYLNGEEDCISKGAYSNSPHLLTRIDLAHGTGLLSLVLSQYKKSNDVNYTLSVFCTKGEFKLLKPPGVPQIRKTLKSMWSSNSAGGPPRGTGFYSSNPMWEVSSESDFLIQLQCSTVKDLPINLRLEEKQSSSRVEFDPSQKPIINTGKYRNGFVASEIFKLKKGKYILVPSTFRPDQEGPFLLHINTSVPLTVSEIPCFPILFKRQVSGCWSFDSGTAQGSPNYQKYHKNPQFLIQFRNVNNRNIDDVTKKIAFHVHLNTTNSTRKVGMNLSIFEAVCHSNGLVCLPSNAKPTNKLCGIVSTSHDGVYLSSPLGIELTTSLKDGVSYILIPSTFEPCEVGFTLKMQSTTSMVFRNIR